MSAAPRARLKDIARELGVSIGTVDRGLNGKPGISAATRARVLAFAEQVGYAPNLAARLLQARRPLRVAIDLPGGADPFWDAVRDGIRDAAAPFAPGLHLEFGASELADAPDGLIVASPDRAVLAPRLEEAERRNVPVVFVGGDDVPDSPRLLRVSVDPFVVGTIAGELLARFLPGPGEVGWCTGGLGRQDQGAVLRGFLASLSNVNRKLTLASIVDAHDDERQAERRTTALLRSRPKLKGLCISSTRHALPILRAAEREGRLSGLRVIATDLRPDLLDWVRAGTVTAAIDQRPRAQGHAAFRSLYQILQNRERPPATQRISPGVVIGSTVDLPLDR